MMTDQKIAVFPGSFDPFTKAHEDLVLRGLEIFDQIIIGIGVNSNKKGMFSVDERLAVIKPVFSTLPAGKVDIQFFEGLTIDFCSRVKAQFILRGMRNLQDFESERAIAQHNSDMSPDIETVFLISSGHLSHISSTIIREILINNGNAASFIPEAAWQAIQKLKGA